MPAYRVMVDDNFHFDDDDDRHEHGVFATPEEAIAACKQIVDQDLNGYLEPGLSAAALYEKYTSFGSDPFIVHDGGERVAFSAWDYARERCESLASGSK